LNGTAPEAGKKRTAAGVTKKTAEVKPLPVAQESGSAT